MYTNYCSLSNLPYLPSSITHLSPFIVVISSDELRNFSAVDIQVNEATFSFTEEYFDDVEMEYIVVCEGPPGTTPCMVST